MEFLQLLLASVILSLVYYSGKIFLALYFNLLHDHYFIGFGPRLFGFKLKDRNVSVGIFLPILGLSRIYNYESGIKSSAQSAWQFHDQAIYKRLLVTLGGTASLLLSGILIFITLAYVENEIYLSKDEANKHGIFASELALEAGFHQGDKILLFDGKDYQNFKDVLYPKAGSRYSVLRNEIEHELIISDKIVTRLQHTYNPFISVLAPLKINSCLPNSPAEKAGIKTGDHIIAVNNFPMTGLAGYKSAIESDEDGIIDIKVLREAIAEEVIISGITLNDQKQLGIAIEEDLKYSKKQNTLIEAAIKGVSQTFSMLILNTRGITKLITGEVSNKELRGPIGVANIYSGNYQWERFWRITAIFVIFGSFTNILPLPKSSFWNFIPLIYEGITKRRFSYQTYKNINKIGYYLIFFLFIYIIMMDIINL